MVIFQQCFIIQKVDEIGECVGQREGGYVIFILIAKFKKEFKVLNLE